MAKEKEPARERTRTSVGLLRKVCYLYDDESDAIEAESKLKWCSESEVIRRAIRAYLEL